VPGIPVVQLGLATETAAALNVVMSVACIFRMSALGPRGLESPRTRGLQHKTMIIDPINTGGKPVGANDARNI
jgi:hypothetical protein